MTPFRNDEGNPFNRQSVWPRMPQSQIRLGGAVMAARAPAPAIDEARVFGAAAAPRAAAVEPVVAEPVAVAEPEPVPAPPPEILSEAPPLVAPIGVRRAAPPRRELRLTPLAAAAAVGAGGTAAVFLLLGVKLPGAPAPPPAPSPQALAVGELVAASAPAPAVAPLRAAELVATPAPAP